MGHPSFRSHADAARYLRRRRDLADWCGLIAVPFVSVTGVRFCIVSRGGQA